MLRQQDDRLVDEVVEVESSGLLELLFIGGVDLGRKRALRIPGRGLQGLGGLMSWSFQRLIWLMALLTGKNLSSTLSSLYTVFMTRWESSLS